MSANNDNGQSGRQTLRSSCVGFLSYGATSTAKKTRDIEKGLTSETVARDAMEWKLALYVFGMHGVGAGIISGGVNFLIAWGMYKHTVDPIRLWGFPNTLSGDAALTVFVQTGITWICEALIVRTDIHHHKVEPIPFAPEPKSKVLRWFFGLEKGEGMTTLQIALFNLFRALAIAIPSFCLLWGPSMGVMAAIGTREQRQADFIYPMDYTGPIFKLVYAVILAVFTTPLMAAFWILREGWARKRRDEGKEELPGCPVFPRLQETEADDDAHGDAQGRPQQNVVMTTAA